MQVRQARSHYDFIVIGGGMVGASFALDLARRQANSEASILVLEAIAPSDQQHQPSFDARSTALSFGSQAIYAGMGLWPQIAAAAAAIHEIQVSDRGHFGSTRITAAEQDVSALGYVVENRELGTVLQRALIESEQIQLLAPVQIDRITPTASGMSIAYSSEEASTDCSAALVILADGGRSPICQQLGINRSQESYQQHAVIANVAFDQPHNNIAFERFTEAGPLALLPLNSYQGQQRGSLVWTVAAGEDEALLQCGEAEFLRRLNAAFGQRLGSMLRVGQRFSYPLSLSEAQEQIRPGLVLLGNVAHTLHPVAGQGLNLALRDASCLARMLSAALQRGESPGQMSVLQAYLDAQGSDQQHAIFFTDQMTKLFSSRRWDKVLTRKAGLLGLDLLPQLRQEFARQAMGL